MDNNISHEELVIISSKWLRNHYQNLLVPNCSLVITELVASSNTGEIVDVLGWNSYTSVLIEVKVSRKDFLRDKRKKFRRQPELGVGEQRYYCCPEGLIGEEELPTNWGLLTYKNKELTIVKKAEKQFCNIKNERSMLISYIRRKELWKKEQ